MTKRGCKWKVGVIYPPPLGGGDNNPSYSRCIDTNWYMFFATKKLKTNVFVYFLNSFAVKFGRNRFIYIKGRLKLIPLIVTVLNLVYINCY